MVKQIKEHLQDHHGHGRLPFDASQLNEALSPYDIVKSWEDLDHIVTICRGNARVPIEFEGLSLGKGVECSVLGCGTIRGSRDSLRSHYAAVHEDSVCPEDINLRKVSYQRFNKSNAPYFEVDPRQYLTQPPDEALVEMAQLIKTAIADLSRVDPDKKMREPWLLKVRWDEFIGDRNPSALVKYAAGPESREFPGLRDGLRLMATQIDGRLDSLSDLIKQRLNTEDPAKDGYVILLLLMYIQY